VSRDSLDDVRTDQYGSEPAGSIQVVLGSVVVVALYVVLAWTVISLPLEAVGPLRFAVVVPLLLFLPGYAFLSALFPGRPSRDAADASPLSRSARFGEVRSIEERGITWGERSALSFGLSIVWLPILALVLAATPWSLEVDPIFAILAAFILGFTAVGAVRRARLPPGERFVLPYRRWLADARVAFSRSPADTLLTAVLALSMLAALASIGYALAVPTNATTTSEVYVGTINDSNGSDRLVYEGYPEAFVEGQPVTLAVGIENQERRPIDYTIVAQFQRVEVSNENVQVLERREAQRFQPSVPANDSRDTWRRPHQLIPPFTSSDGDVRLVYLLYEGDAPTNPTIENADYRTWVWPAGEPPPDRTGVNGTAAAGPDATGGPNTTGSQNATGGPNASNAPGGPNGTGPNITGPSATNGTGPNGTNAGR
jgi:uncharacterized membrane protein